MKTFEITSTQNDLVKYCVKLQEAKYRKKEKLILADGTVYEGYEFVLFAFIL